MRNKILLLTLTIMAVLVAGFMLLSGMNRNNGQTFIVQDFPAVLDPANPNIAQAPLTPPPAATRVPPSTSVPTPGTTTEVHPPIPVPDTQPAPELTPDITGANRSSSAQPGPSSAQSNQLSTADKPAAQPAPAKAAGSFDKNGTLTLTAEMQKNGFRKGQPVMVLVDKGSHFTYVLQKQGDKAVIVWRASNAVGAADTPSPPGPYKITQKTKWPAWVPTKSIDPEQKPVHPYNKDRKNPLGVARIRLDKFAVALHGTNAPGSIRSDASHGCIRHSNNDILKIFSMVEKGDTVVITEKFVGTKLSKKMFG